MDANEAVLYTKNLKHEFSAIRFFFFCRQNELKNIVLYSWNRDLVALVVSALNLSGTRQWKRSIYFPS